MKYIRTKDAIFETRAWKKDEFKPKHAVAVYSNQQFPLQSSIAKSDITNQSNTIEELCDEFVYRDLYDYRLLKRIIDMLDDKIKTKIYGAIWTDKGLVYVAKMNEKGELCLL